jgi:hypothetical protein
MGERRVPSIAARRYPVGVAGVSCAWDSTWENAIFCGSLCFDEMRSVEESRWPIAGPPPEIPPAPPGTCEGFTPSVAVSEDQRLRAWVDYADLRIYAWVDGCPFTVVVREHEPLHAVYAPCAASARDERFVVLWNESDPLHIVRVRRVEDCALGQIVDVGVTDRPAAVSMFDDGSFAVFWYDYSIPADPRARLALYDADEPPALLGPPIDITTDGPPPMGPSSSASQLTVTVRGLTALSPGARALAVWQDSNDQPLTDADVFYRLLATAPVQLGVQKRMGLDIGVPKELGDSGQHTAVFRPDGSVACVWTGDELEEDQPVLDRNVYCTVRVPKFK